MRHSNTPVIKCDVSISILVMRSPKIIIIRDTVFLVYLKFWFNYFRIVIIKIIYNIVLTYLHNLLKINNWHPEGIHNYQNVVTYLHTVHECPLQYLLEKQPPLSLVVPEIIPLTTDITVLFVSLAAEPKKKKIQYS